MRVVTGGGGGRGGRGGRSGGVLGGLVVKGVFICESIVTKSKFLESQDEALVWSVAGVLLPGGLVDVLVGS